MNYSIIIDKLRQLSLEEPNEFTLAIYYNWNIEKRSDIRINGHLEGNNMYDILLKYILMEYIRLVWTNYPTNPLSMLIIEELLVGELADREIDTSWDLFNYLLV